MNSGLTVVLEKDAAEDTSRSLWQADSEVDAHAKGLVFSFVGAPQERAYPDGTSYASRARHSESFAQSFRRREETKTSPIQLWEGVVTSVDLSAQIMSVILTDKFGAVPQHSADIELEWVPDQDRDLIKPGAVFYLTLFKEKSYGGSITNSQTLSFRRFPSWNQRQVDRVRANASEMFKAITSKPLAEE